MCANTTRAWRHVHGENSEGQVDRVARILDSTRAEQLRVVMVRQPVAMTRADDIANLLRGHAAALRRGAESGVDLVVGGHIHLP